MSWFICILIIVIIRRICVYLKKVPFATICLDNKKKLWTRISLQSFQKRLRRRYKVEARIGRQLFHGMVTQSTGRLCFVEWKTLSDAQFVASKGRAGLTLTSNNFNEMDKTVMSAKYAFYDFISHFYPPTTGMSSPLCIDSLNASVRYLSLSLSLNI